VSVVLSLAGCNSLLEVQSPLLIDAATLNDPARAPAMVQSAIADFECAFANYALASGLITDELISAHPGGVSVSTWDRRIDITSGGISPCDPGQFFAPGLYLPLSQARFTADDAMKRLDAMPEAAVPQPGKETLSALAAALAGYTYTVLGEGFCEAAFDLGRAQTRPQILALAEQRFTRAIDLAQSAGNDSVRHLALVGRARVRLDVGRTVEAAADASLVPQGFVKYATYSAVNPRRYNRLYHGNTATEFVSVDARFRNLTVGGVPDPRVQVTDAGKPGNDGITRLWVANKHGSYSSRIVLASWREARLIIAEVEGGQSAVDRINEVRAFWGIPAYSSTDPAAIAQQVREERQREFFLEGRRQGDMLRFDLPFDTGTWRPGRAGGGAYGSVTCFRVPAVERDNNPNYNGE
jgi:hypothetical protein